MANGITISQLISFSDRMKQIGKFLDSHDVQLSNPISSKYLQLLTDWQKHLDFDVSLLPQTEFDLLARKLSVFDLLEDMVDIGKNKKKR